MTDSDYGVGYGKPPKHSRWKKGQGGNPKRKRPRRVPSTAELIEKEFAKSTGIKKNGQKHKVTLFEVILHHLVLAMAQGEKKALRLHKKYREFAQRHPTVVYEPEICGGNAEEDYRKLLESRPDRTKEEIACPPSGPMRQKRGFS